MGQVTGRRRGARGGRAFRGRSGGFPVKPVGFDAQGNERGQGDGGEQPGQGFGQAS